jgi:hypothetical protein
MTNAGQGADLGYPLVPRSNRYLRAGQFWALPLRDGRFGCGRVMAVPAFGPSDRVGVVVGLMDWVGVGRPTLVEIAGRGVLEQAKSRFETISNTGGEVLGNRPLELDGLVVADLFGNYARVWGPPREDARAHHHHIQPHSWHAPCIGGHGVVHRPGPGPRAAPTPTPLDLPVRSTGPLLLRQLPTAVATPRLRDLPKHDATVRHASNLRSQTGRLAAWCALPRP